MATLPTESFWFLGALAVALACTVTSSSTPPETAPVAAMTPATPVAETTPVAEPATRAASVEPQTTPPSSQTSTPAPIRRKAPPQSERDCKVCNGDWGIHGISATPSCNCRTTDGGKRCKDGNECQGLCTAADDPEREVTDRGPPARGFFVGRCSKFSSIFGCYRPIDDGAGTKPIELTEPPQMICAD